MMRFRSVWRAGSICGIEVAIHPSWLVIYGLFAWGAATFAKMVSTDLSAVSDLALGLFASLVLFASVIVHEFAHAITARRLGIPIGNITLFLFGGVASIEREPRTARDELLMAAAGPAGSIADLRPRAGATWVRLDTARPA